MAMHKYNKKKIINKQCLMHCIMTAGALSGSSLYANDQRKIGQDVPCSLIRMDMMKSSEVGSINKNLEDCMSAQQQSPDNTNHMSCNINQNNDKALSIKDVEDIKQRNNDNFESLLELVSSRQDTQKESEQNQKKTKNENKSKSHKNKQAEQQSNNVIQKFCDERENNKISYSAEKCAMFLRDFYKKGQNNESIKKDTNTLNAFIKILEEMDDVKNMPEQKKCSYIIETVDSFDKENKTYISNNKDAQKGVLGTVNYVNDMMQALRLKSRIYSDGNQEHEKTKSSDGNSQSSKSYYDWVVSGLAKEHVSKEHIKTFFSLYDVYDRLGSVMYILSQSADGAGSSQNKKPKSADQGGAAVQNLDVAKKAYFNLLSNAINSGGALIANDINIFKCLFDTKSIDQIDTKSIDQNNTDLNTMRSEIAEYYETAIKNIGANQKNNSLNKCFLIDSLSQLWFADLLTRSNNIYDFDSLLKFFVNMGPGTQIEAPTEIKSLFTEYEKLRDSDADYKLAKLLVTFSNSYINVLQASRGSTCRNSLILNNAISDICNVYEKINSLCSGVSENDSVIVKKLKKSINDIVDKIWDCSLTKQRKSEDKKYFLEFFKDQIKIHENSGGNINDLSKCLSGFFNIDFHNDSAKLAVLDNIMSLYIKKGTVEQKDRDYFNSIIDKVLDQRVHKKQSANALEIDKFINAISSFCAHNNYTKSIVSSTDEAKTMIQEIRKCEADIMKLMGGGAKSSPGNEDSRGKNKKTQDKNGNDFLSDNMLKDIKNTIANDLVVLGSTLSIRGEANSGIYDMINKKMKQLCVLNMFGDGQQLKKAFFMDYILEVDKIFQEINHNGLTHNFLEVRKIDGAQNRENENKYDYYSEQSKKAKINDNGGSTGNQKGGAVGQPEKRDISDPYKRSNESQNGVGGNTQGDVLRNDGSKINEIGGNAFASSKNSRGVPQSITMLGAQYVNSQHTHNAQSGNAQRIKDVHPKDMQLESICMNEFGDISGGSSGINGGSYSFSRDDEWSLSKVNMKIKNNSDGRILFSDSIEVDDNIQKLVENLKKIAKSQRSEDKRREAAIKYAGKNKKFIIKHIEAIKAYIEKYEEEYGELILFINEIIEKEDELHNKRTAIVKRLVNKTIKKQKRKTKTRITSVVKKNQ